MSERRKDRTHTESGERAGAECEVERARREPGRDPHYDLANPARDPDPTEYPDPYERRRDPRGPALVDTAAVPRDTDSSEDEEERLDVPRDPSTSEPRPPRNREQALREGFESEH